MATMRRALSLNSVSALSLRARTLTARSRLFSVPSTTSASRLRFLPALSQTRHYAFHAQLENNPNADSLQASQAATGPAKPQTLVEKIVQKYADGLAPGKVVRSGDYVTLRPHATMTHDNTSAVMEKFKGLGATKVNDPSQLVYTADHEVQAEANYSATGKYAKMAAFAQEQGVWMSPPKYGIGHQIMVEEGWAWPQTLCVASDSHSNHYGGVGCLGTPVVRTDAAGLWTLSKFWWQVPPVVKITLTGMLPPGVTGKDVIVALCGLFGDAVLNHVIEFAGSEQTLNSLPIDHRLTISNMTTEFGALGGIFPVDDKLISWYRSKAIIAALGDSERPPTMFSPTSDRINHARIDELDQNRISADPNAVYAKELYMNLSTLSPFVSGPNSVKVANPLSKLEPQNIEIQKAYLVSCTNSRASDIAAAAQVFREAAERGESAKVHPNVEFYLAAASKAEQKFAEEAGDWQILQEAGAKVLPSGCGPCIGLGAGLIQDGETAISASNRNFLGRMGSRVKTNAYLGSPEVVAASAIKGKIAGPNWYEKPDGVEKVIIGEGSGDHVADQASAVMDGFDKLLSEMDSMIASAEGGEEAAPVEAAADGAEELTEVLPGFPEKIEGEILFLDQDQLNTDGIYPGKYTYQSMSKEHMAEVCMENYDSDFGKIAKPGDILVGGYNFGTGSSREQAATSILAKQIPLVIAASFSNIFSRNSINNALMGVEVPKLVERLREAFKDDKEKPLTRRTGWKLLWDVRRSKVVITEKDGKTWEQKVGELPPNVQEIASQGLEAWIKTKLQQQQQQQS